MDLVRGDDISIAWTLKKNHETFAIDAGATVRAKIVASNGTTVSPTVTCLSNAVGADWDNSLVVVAFTSAQSATFPVTEDGILEVEVDDGGKRTWKRNGINVLEDYI